MAVIFLDVQNVLTLLDTPPAEKPLPGAGSDTLTFTETVLNYRKSAAASDLMAIEQGIGIDFHIYHQSLADRLTLQQDGRKGPVASASNFLTLGDTAWTGPFGALSQHLNFVELITPIAGRSPQLTLTFTEVVTITAVRNLTITQPLTFHSQVGGYNTGEKCFSGYRALSGPNSTGGNF